MGSGASKAIQTEAEKPLDASDLTPGDAAAAMEEVRRLRALLKQEMEKESGEKPAPTFDDSEEGQEMKRIFEKQCKRFPDIPKDEVHAVLEATKGNAAGDEYLGGWHIPKAADVLVKMQNKGPLQRQAAIQAASKPAEPKKSGFEDYPPFADWPPFDDSKRGQENQRIFQKHCETFEYIPKDGIRFALEFTKQGDEYMEYKMGDQYSGIQGLLVRVAREEAFKEFDDSKEGQEMKRIFESECKRFPSIPKDGVRIALEWSKFQLRQCDKDNEYSVVRGGRFSAAPLLEQVACGLAGKEFEGIRLA